MARTPKYLIAPTQRIYTNPLASPDTAGVYQKTHQTSEAPASAPQTATGAGQMFSDPVQSQEAQQTVEATQPLAGDAFAKQYQQYLASLNEIGADGFFSNMVPKENRDVDLSKTKGLGNGRSSAERATAYAQRAVVNAAKGFIGVNRYQYGGFDCSKFTQTIAAKVKVNIPRTASEQYKYFKAKRLLVPMNRAAAGDIVFLRSSASPSGWHVGIYVGNGKMIDNAGRGIPIAVRNLTGRQILGFGRLTLKVKAPAINKKLVPVGGSAVRYGNSNYTVN